MSEGNVLHSTAAAGEVACVWILKKKTLFVATLREAVVVVVKLFAQTGSGMGREASHHVITFPPRSVLDFFYLLDCLTITGLDRTYHAHHFIFLVSHFNFFYSVWQTKLATRQLFTARWIHTIVSYRIVTAFYGRESINNACGESINNACREQMHREPRQTCGWDSFKLTVVMYLTATSTSRKPGKQLTQLFNAWDTALATCSNSITRKQPCNDYSFICYTMNTNVLISTASHGKILCWLGNT